MTDKSDNSDKAGGQGLSEMGREVGQQPLRGCPSPTSHEPKQSFTIEIEVCPGAQGIRQTREMLKRLLRTWNIRCRSIVPTTTTNEEQR
jgi:hypothetical protein